MRGTRGREERGEGQERGKRRERGVGTGKGKRGGPGEGAEGTEGRGEGQVKDSGVLLAGQNVNWLLTEPLTARDDGRH